MKNIITILLISLFFTGCITAKKCALRFPPKESVKDSLVYKDSLIKLPPPPPIVIPGDTIRMTDTLKCDSIHVKLRSVSSGRLHINYSFENGRFNLIGYTDSVTRTIDSLNSIIRMSKQFHTEIKSVPYPVPDPYIPVWILVLLVIAAVDITVRIFQLKKRFF